MDVQKDKPNDVLLLAFNARYSHSSLAVRSLRANLHELRERCALLEYDIKADVGLVAAALLRRSPVVLGISVYIWNVKMVEELVELLRGDKACPLIVLGGPEAGDLPDDHPLARRVDVIVRGEGERAFYELCRRVLDGRWVADAKRPERIDGRTVKTDALVLPYGEYSARDIADRIVYVEASRGCPFGCEYCISARDRGVRRFEAGRLYAAFEDLLDRGVSKFRFLDRSFNAHQDFAAGIVRFFRERYHPGMQVHLELVPDRLGAALRDEIAACPVGMLHVEVGIQTYNAQVAQRIRRRCDFEQADANIRFLLACGCEVHADLIAGLPGETVESFASGFDRLAALRPHEIQVGILKLLRGAPIARHTQDFGMAYSTEPPYEVLATAAISRDEMKRISRFAASWERLYNRGNYNGFMTMLLDGAESPFDVFMCLSEHLWGVFGRTHSIPMLDMLRELLTFGIDACCFPEHLVRETLRDDYLQGGRRMMPPRFLWESDGLERHCF